MPPASEPKGNLATNPDASASSSSTTTAQDASGRQPTASSSTSAELASAKISLEKSLRRFPDFPIPGINFLDIMPWFLDPAVHATLLRSLELQLLHFGGTDHAIKPDVIVGLDARGFLFGPSLALRLGASFVPVRKKGKLPGPCVTAEYMKEYGADYFQMQEGVIKPGQKVLVVDDIIATGGSAAAAGDLIKQLGGSLVGFLFIIEIPFLKGRDKLDNVPVVTLLDVNE
ncbi:adenine phosphoribosyltransferase [Diaporthe helianthi]|uniref:adenine phosphoribosyltransferase n=1 Tax=Diaporthe helianthi TaxID=158607 RepID=A0A2P5HSB6_DIAHE|nr:adenine phosphoribosyltransferase [Diaporthe helianthi]